MTRNDVHSPKNLVTEDYEYVYAIDNKQPGNWVAMMETEEGRKFQRSLMNFDSATADRGTYQCHHCGAHIRYAAFLRYIPTGKMIVVGETCLDNRFERATEDFQRMRKQAVLDQKQQRIKKLKAQFVVDNPDLAWLLDENIPDVIAWNDFVQDISRKLKLYGELSDKQVDAVRKSYDKAVGNEAKRAAEPKINWVTAPVSNERVVVTGTVLSSKWYYGDFGDQLKMRFKVETTAPDGTEGFYTLWTTVPKGMSGDVGERARIKVKVMAGWDADDDSFAKGNRPHLIELLKNEDVTA